MLPTAAAKHLSTQALLSCNFRSNLAFIYTASLLSKWLTNETRRQLAAGAVASQNERGSTNPLDINTQSIQSQTAESDSESLRPLSDIKNPAKLKEISSMKLTDSNFREWKNMMLAEFEYYGVDKLLKALMAPLPLQPSLYIGVRLNSSSFELLQLPYYIASIW